MSLKRSSAALALTAALGFAPAPAEGQAQNSNPSATSGSKRVSQSAQREQRVKDAAEIRDAVSRGAGLNPDQQRKYSDLVTVQRADTVPVLRFYLQAISSDVEHEIGIGVISASPQQRDKLASAAADAAIKWNMSSKNSNRGQDGEYRLIDSVYVMQPGTGEESYLDGRPILDISKKKIEMAGPAAEGAMVIFYKGVLVSYDNQRRPMKFEPQVVMDSQGRPQKNANGQEVYSFSRDDLKEIFRTLLFAEKLYTKFIIDNPNYKKEQAQRVGQSSGESGQGSSDVSPPDLIGFA